MLAAFAHVGLVLGPAPHARAEMSEDDYRSPGAIASPAQRERTAAELERARREAADAEARREAEARARRQRELDAIASLPAGERLLRQRCTACHGLAGLEGVSHGPLGWRFVVERMRWRHGAALDSGEAAVIAGHLHRERPANRVREWAEVAVASVLVVLPLGLSLVWARHRRRRGVGS